MAGRLEPHLPPSRIVAAPMAGGPTTVELATAVADAGGLPFLAAGYKTAEAMADEIDRLAARTGHFGVNLFAPATGPAVDAAALQEYAARLEGDAAHHGVRLDPTPVVDDDSWAAKLAVLRSRRVPLVSFTFALPSAEEVAALQAVGTAVLSTVTSPEEATAAAAVGVDGLVVQGSDAGGHSGTHDPARPFTDRPTEALVREVLAVVDLPVIAAGGVDGPAAVERLVQAGAVAVAVGTLLLLADEAGTSPTHRAALTDPAFTETVVTRAFTGRPARALRNAFADRHTAHAPVAYPAVHHLTRPLRQAAAQAGDAERLHLWAGTGWRSSRAAPAAELIAWLAGDTPATH